jgi:peptide chain release factor subunit 1
MIRQEDIQELLAFEAGESEVVSLYLNADTSQQTNEIIKLQARGLLKEANTPDADSNAIEQYLDLSFGWDKPGLAVFSCAKQDFFRAFPSAVSYRNRVRISGKPHVKPLAHFLDYYAHYGVIVVDRIGARFFEYHLGELQDSSGFMGEDVRKLKHGGGSARGGGMSSATGQRGDQGGRHEEEVALRNLRDAAAEAQRFFARKPIRRLFLGGTNENVAQYRELLSKRLQSCLAGSFAIDMNAGEHEVRQLSLGLLRDANSEREKKLVEQMVTLAAKGSTAVLGLDGTLQAVNEGRVQTLVISDGYRTPGYVHEQSRYLLARETDEIPFVNGGKIRVNDVVEAAVARTMEQGGHIEIISDNPELDNIGYIGALLRY